MPATNKKAWSLQKPKADIVCHLEVTFEGSRYRGKAKKKMLNKGVFPRSSLN